MTYLTLSRGTRSSLFKEDIKSFLGPTGLAWARTKLRGKSFFHPKFHERKAIFIHVPKSAGTSLGEELFGCGQTGHFEWTYYHAENPRAFDEYFKFGFVREPVSRFLSAFNYLLEGGKSATDQSAGADLSRYRDLSDFIENGFYADGWSRWVHFRTQSSFLFDGTKQKVDFIGRTENFDADCQRLSKKLSVPIAGRISNSGKRKGYSRADISPIGMGVLREFYAEDFRNLGYDLPAPEHLPARKP